VPVAQTERRFPRRQWSEPFVGLLNQESTMADMRAKMKTTSVKSHPTCEFIKLNAVGPSGAYPADGADENNTFARFTPQAELSMTIVNPDLLGKFEEGAVYYLDFTRAP
jgi:hypothetical protein